MKKDKLTADMFPILNVSSKMAICGLPLRADTYKTCTFGCKYCFSNGRKVMCPKNKSLLVGNIDALERKLKNIFENGRIISNNYIDRLISGGYTWHCGGMADPFQPCEETYHITEKLVELSNKYNIKILFSTKSDNLYGAKLNPKLHSFQFSVTSINENNELEPNVPSIEKRLKLFKELKSKGFKVGIRIQPLIPGVSSPEIIEMFKEADHFTIEGLKLVPQNKEQQEYLLKHLNMTIDDFSMKGLYNIKPEIRIKLYEPFIKKLEEYNLSYSIADNDLRFIGNNKCCCGDKLVGKTTSFNTTALIRRFGTQYDLDEALNAITNDGLAECNCKGLFASNRQAKVKVAKDYLICNFNSRKNPASPLFQHDCSRKNETEKNSEKISKKNLTKNKK